MHGLRKAGEYSLVYTIGSVGYSMIEVLWRGFTHWSMTITGGICFLALYITNIKMSTKRLWEKCLVGAVLITAIEFLVGCVVNRMLHWDVWDYSRMKINLLGQVCLLYSMLWFVICIPASFFCNFLRRKLQKSAKDRKSVS